MKGVLLDTMVVLWATYAPARLSRSSVELVTNSSVPLCFSVVSLWEVGIKMGKGGFSDLFVDKNWCQTIPHGMRSQGIEMIEVSSHHCGLISRLPFHHRDPSDRMIFAQAIAGEMSLVSCDPMAARYVEEVIW